MLLLAPAQAVLVIVRSCRDANRGRKSDNRSWMDRGWIWLTPPPRPPPRTAHLFRFKLAKHIYNWY